MIKYFKELLQTLKNIEQHLKVIREQGDIVSSCVTTSYGRTKSSIRTAGPHD